MNNAGTKNKWLKLFSTEFVILLLLLIAAILIFVYAVDMVFIQKKTTFDEKAFVAVSEYVTPARTSIFRVISFLGKHTFLIPANFLLIFYFLQQKNRWFAIRVGALALSSLSLMFLLKLTFQRLRPDVPLLEKVQGFSFPSGHALMSVVFYGLLIYIAWHEIQTRWIKNLTIAFLGVLILLIGFSRIYLRVHYASDVIAGFAVGFGWLLISSWTISKIEKRFSQRNNLG